MFLYYWSAGLFHDKNNLSVAFIALEKNVFSCQLCNALFSRKENLNMHIKRDHGKKKFQCLLCKENFISHSNLKIHIKGVHEGKTLLKCFICEKEFLRKKVLNHHNLESCSLKSELLTLEIFCFPCFNYKCSAKHPLNIGA